MGCPEQRLWLSSCITLGFTESLIMWVSFASFWSGRKGPNWISVAQDYPQKENSAGEGVVEVWNPPRPFSLHLPFKTWDCRLERQPKLMSKFQLTPYQWVRVERSKGTAPAWDSSLSSAPGYLRIWYLTISDLFKAHLNFIMPNKKADY